MKIGRRIYFDLETGNVLVDTGERQGSVRPTTTEQDIATYKVLNERVIGTFAYIELPYGQYAQDFRECNGYRVNVDMISDLPFEEGYKALEFSYPDPNAPEEPQPYQAPLSEKVESLEQEKMILQLALAETIEKQETDKINNQLALAELVETLTLKGVL